eukprot:CAMPEP_0117660776 /NCGR_PEP_ID=MMETSP0804-20121206/7147_1 /TAXON_ID=1074897 /ORGANISM="Tetraselmis astigmatica, Strain CCMP880" /LENGTH=30 /DNA_ID= /DNA_START= /DNA_END= /DNA_ORIENTATION=
MTTPMAPAAMFQFANGSSQQASSYLTPTTK